MHYSIYHIAAFAAAIPAVLAQTSTDCNPLEKTCKDDVGLFTSTYSADFSKGPSANASWSAAAYSTIDYGTDGAIFRIAKAGQAPTITTGKLCLTCLPSMFTY